MIYFYGFTLVVIMILLLAGCITNNSYTATGKSKQTVNKEKKTQFKRDLTLEGHSINSDKNRKSSSNDIM